MRVPFEQRNKSPTQPKVVYALILDIKYFCYFLDILENYNLMDDEPMWDADRVVAIKGSLSKACHLSQARNEHVNAVFTWSGKSYDPPINPNGQTNDSKNLVDIDNDDEDEEPTPQPKVKDPKPTKETSIPKPYKPKIPYPQRLRKEKMETQYEEYYDSLLDEGSKILYFIEGIILEEKQFAEFDEFMAMTADENYELESDTEEPPLEKITFNTDYKIKTSPEKPPLDLELKPLLDNLEYVFLEEPSFLPVIVSS
nr:reverse transcriptase domain-containing protein [Tanacetum cinerariifolium]